MKLPEPIDTTALATYQDQVLARTDWGHGRARAHLINLSKWDLMLSSLPTSNLRIRQTLIQAGLNHILGEPLGQAHEIARKMFDELRRDGLWLEGPDYMEYSAVAVEWYCEVVGVDTVMQDHIAEMRWNYLNMVAPDGTIPVPEARDTKYPVPYTDAATRLRFPGGPHAFLETPSHIRINWYRGAYLLVCLDTNPEPLHNYHAHLAAGYFAFGVMRDGEFDWQVRCKRYTGFNFQESFASEAFAGLLPPGALLPTWRIKPPRVTVKRLEDGVRIEWKNPWMRKSTRTLTWGGGTVRCVDTWGWFGKKVREWSV